MTATAQWRKHPQSGLWHAHRPDEASRLSVCGYTRYRADQAGELQAEVPKGEFPCRVCWYRIHGNRQCPKRPTPDLTNRPALEHMEAEFVSGPFDGMRLTLTVLRESPDRFRVIANEYVKRFKPAEPVEASEDARPRLSESDTR